MALKFCPKCGSMMIPEKDGDSTAWTCRKCGHVEKSGNEKIVIKQEINEKKEIPVVDVNKEKDKLSVIDVECSKCGNVGALWWLQQTRSADEPSTRFFKCIKCGHTWREYA